MYKKILFVHHGSALGGAPLSLLYLMKGLDPNLYECVACSAWEDPEVLKLFSINGFEVHGCRMLPFAHTTGQSYAFTNMRDWIRLAVWIKNYPAAKRRLAMLISRVQPDILHLNSLVLAPYACVGQDMGIPTVVHVREVVQNGVFGIRKGWLQHHLNTYATKVIAICCDNYDRLALKPGMSEIIYNFVDFERFDYRLNRSAAMKSLGIPLDAKVVLFTGGAVALIKGRDEFIAAMGIVRQSEKRLICLLPGFEQQKRAWTWKRRVGRLIGRYRRAEKRLTTLIQRAGLVDCILTTGFRYDIENFIAASDVVCIPHIKPHFSRMVVEAGAMKKPVVAFRIGGVEEVVSQGKTGLLVEVGDVRGLADATLRLLKDKALSRKIGEGGYQQAIQLFDVNKNAARVANIYKAI